jgi:hypothetical protein
MIKNTLPAKGAIYVIGIDDGLKLGKTQNLKHRYVLYNNAHKDNPVIRYVYLSYSSFF